MEEPIDLWKFPGNFREVLRSFGRSVVVKLPCLCEAMSYVVSVSAHESLALSHSHLIHINYPLSSLLSLPAQIDSLKNIQQRYGRLTKESRLNSYQCRTHWASSKYVMFAHSISTSEKWGKFNCLAGFQVTDNSWWTASRKSVSGVLENNNYEKDTFSRHVECALISLS